MQKKDHKNEPAWSAEEQYRRLFEGIPVGLYRTTPEGQIVAANPALAQMLGYPDHKSLLELSAAELYVDPEERGREQRLLEREGVVQGFEMRLRRRDGTTIYARDTARAVRDADGRLLHYEGALEDISRYRQSEEKVRRRTAQLEALREISLELTAQLEPEALLRSIVSRAVDLVGGSSGGLALYRPERDDLELVVGFGLDEIPPGTFVARGEGLSGRVLDSRQPMVVDSYSQWEERAEDLPCCYDGAIVAVPVQWADQFLGVLQVWARPPQTFSAADVELASLFATQAAIAIRNAQLFEAAAKQSEDLAALHDAAVAILSNLELEEVLHVLAQRLGQAVDVTACTICDLGRETTRSTVLATWAAPQATEGEKGLPVGGAVDMRRYPGLLQSLREEQPLTLQLSDPRLGAAEKRHAQQVGWKSCLIVPIVGRQRAIGYAGLWESRWKRTFTQAERQLCQTIAADAALAIEQARLFEAERKQRELAEALEEAAKLVNSTLNLDQVLDRILEHVERVVDGDAFNIMLVAEDGIQMIRQRGYERLDERKRMSHVAPLASKYPLLRKMGQDKNPVVAADTAADPDWVELEDRHWLRSYVAAPICVEGEVAGFLNVDGVRPRQFDNMDAQRLKAFADHAATALHNAWLHQELRTEAEKLEQRVHQRTEEIQAQYSRLEAVLSSATDGIVVTDREGQIVQTNPIADRWLNGALPEEDAAALGAAVQDAARRATDRSWELLELSQLDLQVSAAPIVGPRAEGSAVVVLHDVTRLKELDRMKTRFVSNVSHQLRTPITTVKLYLELLRRDGGEQKQRYLDLLDAEAERLILLVEDILHLSRSDAHRLDLELESVPLNEITGKAVSRHRVLAEQKGIALECRTLEPAPVAMLDVDQMSRAIDNLLSNAIQYTPAGGRVVASAGWQRKEGRDWAVMAVRDTGMGIAEEELPHIFDRFFRGKEPQRRQLPGTGLGLPIAKDIVELHGGEITVESRPDEGTTFTILLPLNGHQQRSVAISESGERIDK